MSQSLIEISNNLADAVENISSGLVQVDARRRLPATGVVWSQDGVIVTAHHVVQRDEGIIVGLPGGERVNAALVGHDPTTDLAVLRVEGVNLAAPSWGEPDNLRVGSLVLAVGRPGQNPQASLGVVRALGGSWHTPAGGYIDRYLQADVVMYPGFSGGPLLDAEGRVRGVNTSALLRGANLTIPTPTVRRVTESLLSHGRIRRGYLGIGGQPAHLPEGLAAELGQETGILLASVEPGSPAEKGGLVLGDTIVAFDGLPVRHLNDLLALLSGERVGQDIPVRILRGGTLQEVTVTVGERE